MRQCHLQTIWVVFIDYIADVGSIAERLPKQIGNRDVTIQALQIMARPCRRKRPDCNGAPGDRGGPGLNTQLGDLIDRNGQHIGRQSIAEARERINESLSMIVVVEHKDRVASPCPLKGKQQRAHSSEQRS